MPRLKNKPIELDEQKFVDWLLEIYYYRFMDQGVKADATPLQQANTSPENTAQFMELIRAQLTRFDLTFPLTKLPALHQQALREISLRPTRPAWGEQPSA